jgi:predicted transcriptional regulator
LPRRKSLTLTGAELRIMEVLWQKGTATVAEVAALMPPPPIAYNSILTTMRILERKGHVRHTEAGRAFVYRPAIERDEAARSAVGDVLNRFFRNKPGKLALSLIENERPSRDELERLRSLIDSYEEGRQPEPRRPKS